MVRALAQGKKQFLVKKMMEVGSEPNVFLALQ